MGWVGRVGAWPTLAWQCTQETVSVELSPEELGDCMMVMSWTKSAWQRRQFSWRILALAGPIMMGSWKFWRVKAEEWFQPLRALAMSLGTSSWGRWHSMQVATWWWP